MGLCLQHWTRSAVVVFVVLAQCAVYVLDVRGSLRLEFLCANNPLYSVCMFLADHSLTPNLTIFELMCTLAFCSPLSDSSFTMLQWQCIYRP